MTIFNDIKVCYGFLLCNFYSVQQLILALLCQNLKSGFMKRLEINKCGAKANCLFFLQFGPYLCVSFSSSFFFYILIINLTYPYPIFVNQEYFVVVFKTLQILNLTGRCHGHIKTNGQVLSHFVYFASVSLRPLLQLILR